MDGDLPGEDYNPYTFVYRLTTFFAVIAIIALYLVPKGPDRDLYRVSIVEAAFFMWLAWVTIYCGQVYPSEPLTFKKEKIVFISHAWGNVKGVKKIELPTTTTPSTTRTTMTTTTQTATTPTETMPTETTLTETTPTETTPTETTLTETTPTETTLTTNMTQPPTSPTTTPTTTPNTTLTTTNTSTETESTSTIVSTTRRPWYYRTYAGAWKRKQYFWAHNKYFDFSVKTSGRVTVYISYTRNKRDHNVDVIIQKQSVECIEIQSYLLHGETLQKEIRLHKLGVTGLINNDEYRRFWIEFRSPSKVRFGRHGVRKPLLNCHRRHYKTPFDNFYWLQYISFATIGGEGDWLIHKGVQFGQVGHYGESRRRLHKTTTIRTTTVALRSSATQVVTSPAYVEVKPSYKIIPIIGEPIEFGVLVEQQKYREFFVLLSPTYKRVDSSILIHIGSNQGRTCTITKNWKVVKLVKCKLKWYQHFYLQFWVYYKNGTIAVKAGYSTPDLYPAFISWTDPEPSPHKYYGLRTVVGTQIPMSVIEVVHPEEL